MRGRKPDTTVGAGDGRAALEAAGARTMLVERRWPLASALAADPGWKRMDTFQAPSGEVVDVYVRPGGPPSPGG